MATNSDAFLEMREHEADQVQNIRKGKDYELETWKLQMAVKDLTSWMELMIDSLKYYGMPEDGITIGVAKGRIENARKLL